MRPATKTGIFIMKIIGKYTRSLGYETAYAPKIPDIAPDAPIRPILGLKSPTNNGTNKT